MPATARPELTPSGGAPADADSVDVATIRATIARALVQGPVPQYRVLVELEELLCGHIGLLLPYGEAAVAELDRDSVEYDGQREFLRLARDRMNAGLGTGLISARIQVTQLAHDCHTLLRYVEPTS